MAVLQTALGAVVKEEHAQVLSQDLCELTNLRQLGIETRLPSRELRRSVSGSLTADAPPEPLPALGVSAIPDQISRLSKVCRPAYGTHHRTKLPMELGCLSGLSAVVRARARVGGADTGLRVGRRLQPQVIDSAETFTERLDTCHRSRLGKEAAAAREALTRSSVQVTHHTTVAVRAST